MAENTIKEIKAFFGAGTRNVTMVEFKEFWDSCDDTEKEYYKSADLAG